MIELADHHGAGRCDTGRLDGVRAEVQEAVLAPLTRNERQTFVRLLDRLTG